MAGFQVVEPSAGSTDWTDFSVMFNNVMQGFMALSLTNYDTTGVPLIAAGGQVEVAGSLYTFASTEAITGSLSTNQNYIMLTTSSSSITASYTSDAPTWVPSKSGWYDSSTGVQRYVGGSATDLSAKWVYDGKRSMNDIIADSGLLTSLGALKFGTFTRTASGTTRITGIGFKPSLVLMFAHVSQEWSVGFASGTDNFCMYSSKQGALMARAISNCAHLQNTSGIPPQPMIHSGFISDYHEDGFTFASSETTGAGGLNMNLTYVAIP